MVLAGAATDLEGALAIFANALLFLPGATFAAAAFAGAGAGRAALTGATFTAALTAGFAAFFTGIAFLFAFLAKLPLAPFALDQTDNRRQSSAKSVREP